MSKQRARLCASLRGLLALLLGVPRIGCCARRFALGGCGALRGLVLLGPEI